MSGDQLDLDAPRWVSCSKDTNWTVADHRHLTRKARVDGWTDTLCGATGTPGAFRADNRKPECPACVAIAAHR